MHYLDYTGHGEGLDLSDTITRVCICGNDVFRTVVTIDEDYEISMYGLDGECVECNTRVKLPCPLDHPNFVR